MRHDAFELEVLPGLEPLCAQEVVDVLGYRQAITGTDRGRVALHPSTDIGALLTLRIANAVYAVVTAPVPRPKGLLGHQHWARLEDVCRDVQRSDSVFRTLGLDAAGSDSAVMQRIRSELAGALGLVAADDKGDLHVRIRPEPRGTGWQALVRLTPRPLATRPWRIHNYDGALNACIASAMLRLAKPHTADRVINLCCGSGTLLVELAQSYTVQDCIGVDVNTLALALSVAHLDAGGVKGCTLIAGDATRLPLRGDVANVIVADLPFGQRVGSHADNLALYPALLNEAARVAVEGARFVLITHEKRLIRQILRDHPAWNIVDNLEINQNGLHPVIVVLERR